MSNKIKSEKLEPLALTSETAAATPEPQNGSAPTVALPVASAVAPATPISPISLISSVASATPISPVTQPTHFTLALLIENLNAAWSNKIWLHTAEAARSLGAHLICFPGRILQNPDTLSSQANILYDLVSAARVDGLITLPAGLGMFVGPDAIGDFCRRFNLPVVSLEMPFSDIPSVLTNDYESMREAIIHLVEVHGRRRILFNLMAPQHAGHAERYRAYTETLAAYGLPFDPRLTIIHAPRPERFAAALDERQLRPGTDFDAVAGSDDTAAYDAIQVLQARGVQLPDAVSVIGFDNLDLSRTITPSLTTVQPPYEGMAWKAVEALLARIAGKETLLQTALTGKLIVRESCGCPSAAMRQARLAPMPAGGVSLATLAGRPVDDGAILTAIEAALETPVSGLDPLWAEQLFKRFIAEQNGDSPGAFISTLSEFLRRTAGADSDVEAWHGPLSALYQTLLPRLADNVEALLRAESLLHQARVLISERAQRQEAHRSLQAMQQAGLLREIGSYLLSTHDTPGLMDILAYYLPRLGIPGCYLSVYEDPQPYQYPQPAPEWSRLLLAYTGSNRLALEPEGRRFRSRELAPEALLQREQLSQMAVISLHFRDQQLGFVVFEAGPRDGAIYEILGEQLSSALQSTLITQQVQHRAVQLRTTADISRVVTSILELDDLLAQVVELLRKRFDLHYVGLFLLDETERYAALRAATGEAGRKQLAARRQLAVNDASAVGWCIAHRQARLVQDVGNETGRFLNPELPETRSELTMPLITRERVIGAVSIQSSRPAAFSTDDVLALRAMADQTAIAIENARLFEEHRRTEETLAKRAVELETVVKVSTQVSQLLEVDKLLQEVVDLTKTRFNLYHTHIYLLNESGDQLQLKAGAGEVGRDMVADGRVIPFAAEQSLVARAARTRQSVIVNDVTRDPGFLPHPLLPNTRSEIAAPVIVGDKLLGVLDVQSDLAFHFTEEDAHILNILAAQIAVALQNARQHDQTQTALRELEIVTRQLIRTGWHEYLSQQSAAAQLGYVYDLHKVERLDAGARQTQPLTGPTLEHDLTLRGETIGRLALAGAEQADAETGEIVAAVADQLSAHLEKLRLSELAELARFQSEQRAAELEAIAKVSAATSSILDVDELLDTVVDLTQTNLDLYHVHIYTLSEMEDRLELAAGSGAVGRKMVVAGHTILLNREQSIVARVARNRQGVIVNDVRADPTFLPNPHLPLTRAELAVPMIAGDSLLGVFDFQSDRVNHFTEDDIRLKAVLADQVAIALQNARLYAEQSSTVVRLRELDQLKSSFLANMSHELRTPLNSILGFAQVMLEGIDGDITPPMENDLNVIQKNGQHLLNLISDILDMAKIEAGKMTLNIEIFDLKEVLEEVIKSVGPLAGARSLALNLDTRTHETLTIYADRMRVRQVMINIVNNAVKFTDKGGITLTAWREGATIRIAVKDTGLGIPVSHLEKIFEEFSQVDSSTTRKAGGTGLGLPISRHLVEMHGGKLWAESSGVPGEGSTFIIELPVESTYTL